MQNLFNTFFSQTKKIKFFVIDDIFKAKLRKKFNRKYFFFHGPLIFYIKSFDMLLPTKMNQVTLYSIWDKSHKSIFMENENRYFSRRSVDISHAADAAVCDCIQYKSGASVLRRSRYVSALLPRGQAQALCARQDALTTRGMKLMRCNTTSKIHTARLVV